MIRPIVELERPWRSERARSLRWKPSSAIASPTRAAVAAATPDSPLMTRETVFRLTPARCATSRIVGLVALTATFLLTPPEFVTTLPDNVVGEEGTGPRGEVSRARAPGHSRPAAPRGATVNRGWVGRRVRMSGWDELTVTVMVFSSHPALERSRA
jgi:hypothetical protein